MTSIDAQQVNLPDTSQSKQDSDLDEMIAAYKQNVDLTLLREIQACTVEQRLIRLMQLQKFYEEMRAAGERARKADDYNSTKNIED